MEKATFVHAYYQHSDTRELQGSANDSEIKRYLNNGYYVKESRNGYWVLVRSAHIFVTLKTSDGEKEFEMKHQILDLYGKQRISEKTYEKFSKDARSGKINFYVDGFCCSMQKN